MERVFCKECEYNLLQVGDNVDDRIYPYLRTVDGNHEMLCVSPTHGRSYVVGKTSAGRYIISKGNGLSYSQYNFINTREIGDETLGLLLKKDAFRDFNMGLEIESLGIKTNRMEYVIELSESITLPNGKQLHPVLLQYDVNCPYRISDAAFMTSYDLNSYVREWKSTLHFEHKYLIATECLLKNLKLLHDNKILHNAITIHNITWSLELLDFELACSPRMPYDSEEERRHVQDLFSREIIGTYYIIKYIAGVLGEPIDYTLVEKLFLEFGFNIKEYKV